MRTDSSVRVAYRHENTMLLSYIARRIAIAIPVLLGITVVIFFMSTLAPGNPVVAMIPPDSDLPAETIQARMEALGLNKPWPVRYGLWLKEIATGNLGYSLVDQRPVADKIINRLWPTIQLAGTAILISVCLGVPLGVISALKQYSVLDNVLTILTFIGVSTPGFFAALAMIYVFSFKLGLFPTSGMRTPTTDYSVVDNLQHLVLPAIVLSLDRMAEIMRYSRSAMLEVKQQDFVVTARAKGLPERTVIGSHALRNALIPLITIIGLGLPLLFSGAVIIEVIFSWPGMGLMAINAIKLRDYPVIMGFNLFAAITVLISSLLADLAYSFVDPRIRYT